MNNKNISDVELLNSMSNDVNLIAEQNGEWKRVNSTTVIKENKEYITYGDTAAITKIKSALDKGATVLCKAKGLKWVLPLTQTELPGSSGQNVLGYVFSGNDENGNPICYKVDESNTWSLVSKDTVPYPMYSNFVSANDKAHIDLANRAIKTETQLQIFNKKVFDVFKGGFTHFPDETERVLEINHPGIYLFLQNSNAGKKKISIKNKYANIDITVEADGIAILASDTGVVTVFVSSTGLSLPKIQGTYQAWNPSDVNDKGYEVNVTYHSDDVVWYLGNSNNSSENVWR